MANLVSQLILRLVDGVSRPARQATGSIRGVTRAIGQANGAQLAAMAEANIRNISRLRGELIGAAATAGAFAVAMAVPVRAARDFQSGLTDIAQKGELSAAQVAALGKSIRQTSRDTNQLASEVSRGIDVLVGFGLGVEQASTMMGAIGKASTAYKADVEDLARASYAVVNNLGVSADQTGKALDVMAQAGKAGGAELKDMARYFPSMAAQAQALGQTGVAGLADLSAAFEVVRQQAGESSEAATRLSDLMAQMKAPRAIAAFRKQGVDLLGSLSDAAKRGLTPLEAIAQITDHVVKTKFGGDLGQLRSLFGNEESAAAVRSLIQGMDDYKRIRSEALAADGVVERDFAERMKNVEEKLKAAKRAGQDLAISLGTALLPAVTVIAQGVAALVDAVTAWTDKHPALTRAIVLTTGALIAFRLASVALAFGKAQVIKALIDMAPMFMNLRKTALGAAMAFRIAGISIRGMLVASGIGLLIVAAGLLVEHWRGVVTFFQGFGRGFAQAIGPLPAVIQPLVSAVRGAARWIGKLVGADGQEDWSKFGVVAGRVVGQVVKAIAMMFSPLTTAIDLARKFWSFWRGGPVKTPAIPAAPQASGARAGGGRVSPGKAYWVGDGGGPEIFKPETAGSIVANYPARRAGGGGSTTLNVSVGDIIVHGAQDARAVAARVADEISAAVERRLRGIYADGPIRA